jgi:polyphosphate kinase
MKIINRDISWLSFNERVLQEASDARIPLIERMRFLGIYSNNLDEFYRVRVANIKRVMGFDKNITLNNKGTAQKLYAEIRDIVMKQQKTFEKTYQQIIKELDENNILLINDQSLSKKQIKQLDAYYNLILKHAIVPIILDKKTSFPVIKDSSIYLAIKIVGKDKKNKYALIQIPTDFSRFYRLDADEKEYFILLDDIIRFYLKNIFKIFEFEEISAYTFKFSRDAELNLDDDYSETLIEKIEKSLKQRVKGKPVRFVYDQNMPEDLLNHLLKSLDLSKNENAIPGGKYHNFKDFISFPSFGHSEFKFIEQIPCIHPELEHVKSLIETIADKDILLHFPYQRFDYIVDTLREAAIDPTVKSIKINVYRVAKQSQIMNALIAAINNGKKVTVFLELQARFDEENNLNWANKLKEHGAKVLFGMQHFKVHSKLMQIARQINGKEQLISYIGTGNFNERTSLIYGDLGLLTANPTLGNEVKKVFRLLENNMDRGIYRELLVSPMNTRRKLIALIDKEIKFAEKKQKATIKIKLNNLTDPKIIEKLYRASQAGVKIDMIIRGVCCLIPGVKDLSENIRVISIVGRYLEHARFFIFENDKNPSYFISSADWMERNFDKRIEVGCPIYDKSIQKELEFIFEQQWNDTVNARHVCKDQKNTFIHSKSDKPFNSQLALFNYYEKKAKIID